MYTDIFFLVFIINHFFMSLTKDKRKSILIDDVIHQKAKEYCAKKFLKLSCFIEGLILNEINKSKHGK